MTDYSGEGGAKYFNESEARTLIHRGDVVLWNSIAPFKNRDQLFIDGEVVEHPSQLAYFLNIRSNRLVLRCGDSFFVEPYSPHRFSRQFGYCQYIPKDLQHDERSTTSDMALRYWRTCIRYKTGSRALFPSSPPSFRRHITSSFFEWWKKVHGDYLIKGRDFLIKSTQPDPSKAKGAKRVKGNERDKLQLPPKTMKDTSTRVPVLESMKKKHEELHSSTKHVEDTSTGRLAVEGMGKAREKLLSPTRQVEDTSTRRLTVEGEGKEREKLSSPTQQVEDTSTRRLAVEGEGKEREKLSSPTQQVEDTSTRRLAVNQVETFARSRPRIVIKYPTKAMPVNDGNNKRSISQDVEESSTSQEERHWKRSKKARTPYFDDLGIGDKFFDGVSTPLVPLEDIGRGLQLDDFEMPDVELIPEGSGDSVDGPDSFDLHARRSEDKLPPMKAHPTASVVSTFRGEDLISDCQRVYLSSLWSGLSHKIAKHRLELLNSVEEEAEKVLKEMDRINAIDIMPLKGLLAKFFQDIGLYNAVRSSSAEKMSRERQEDLLAQTNSRLSDIEGKKNQKTKHVQSIDSTLADMDSEEAQLKIEEAQLKTRFHDLHVRREEAKSLRLREEEELLQIREDASRLKEEVSTIKNAAIQSDEDTQNLERMKDLLEANRRELIDFKLFS